MQPVRENVVFIALWSFEVMTECKGIKFNCFCCTGMLIVKIAMIRVSGNNTKQFRIPLRQEIFVRPSLLSRQDSLFKL